MKKNIIGIVLVVLLTACAPEKKEEVVDVKEYKTQLQEQNTQSLYYYMQLDEENKKLYEVLFDALSAAKTEVIIDVTNIEQIEVAMEYISYDHPEIYYLNQYTIQLTSNKDKAKLNFEYFLSPEEIEETNALLEEVTQSFIATIPTDATQQKITKLAYDYITSNVTYNEISEYNQSLISALIKKESVCAGYAKAYQYLLQKVGVWTTYLPVQSIEEETQGVSHALNMVKLDDDYFYIDSTWGDIEGEHAHACNAYYMLSSTDMLALYTPAYPYKDTITNTYTFNEYSKDAVVLEVERQYQMGKGVIELKFNPSIYAYAYNRLITNEDIFKIFSQLHIDITSVQFMEKPEIGFLEIYY